MKKAVSKLVLSVAMVMFFIVPQACNPSGKNQDQAQTEAHEHSETDEDHHDHESIAAESLTLDNGTKWEADEPTNNNANLLISIGDRFSDISNKTLEDYQIFGKDILGGINKMIQECSMEGAADHALHLWFLPLLEQSRTLQEATDTTGLASLTSEMIHRLNEYYDYFE